MHKIQWDKSNAMHGELKEGKNDAQDFLCENCGELFMDKKIIKEHGIIVD